MFTSFIITNYSQAYRDAQLLIFVFFSNKKALELKKMTEKTYLCVYTYISKKQYKLKFELL